MYVLLTAAHPCTIFLIITVAHPLWLTGKGSSGNFMLDSTTIEAHYCPTMDSYYSQLTFAITACFSAFFPIFSFSVHCPQNSFAVLSPESSNSPYEYRGHSFHMGLSGNSRPFHHVLTQQFLMLWEVPSTRTPNSSPTQQYAPSSSAEEGALFRQMTSCSCL